jgi:hypothetical protein
LVNSPSRPTKGRKYAHPLAESHLLVLEDVTRRHAEPTDARPRHIQAGVLLLLAACALLALLDSLPDRKTTARSPVPAAQAAQRHPGGAGAEFKVLGTCARDRVCAEGGS